MWTHVMQTTRGRIQFLLTEDKYFLSICGKRNPHLVQFPADQAWSVSWCGWRSVYNVETKSGRGLARQIGKPILPIRSHQNPRSEYDHLSPMVIGQLSPVTKEHEHEVISIGYWGTEFMWTIQIKIFCCKTQKIVLAFMTRIGWVDVRFEPPLWLRLPSWILMALSSKSSGSALLASRNFEIQICVHSCSVVGLWSNFCKGIERVNNCRWSYAEVNFPARALGL